MSCRKTHASCDRSHVRGEADSGRGDPATRVTALEVREHAWRTAAAIALSVLAATMPFVAGPLTGGAGAVVGAVVASLLLLALAFVVWPYDWSADEGRHRELEAIWH